jgi:dephospho-CoA kinase
VAGWLGTRGAAIVDADRIAREVTAPGEPSLDAIFDRFGDPVRGPDGTLDRAALARIVFADRGALRELEAIVHPAVRPRLLAAVEAAERRSAPVVVIEAIRLVESGLAEICDEVWLVVCDRQAQRERLARRRSGQDTDQRIAAQEGIVDRLRPAATRVIDTSGSPKTTRQAVLDDLDDALTRA